VSDDPGDNGERGGDRDGWPVDIRGITESVVTTRQPDGGYNAAALGLVAGDPVTSRTWGNTRTRHNFTREGRGYVQFVADPVVFVEAALGIHEVDEPVLAAADAWVEVTVERVGAGEDGGTEWVEWAHTPVETAVETRRVPTVNRGFNATIEATVAASRLDVPAYDGDELRDRLAYFRNVARRCGGDRERAAFDRLVALTGWDPPED